MLSISIDFVPLHLQPYKTLDDYRITSQEVGPEILQVLITDTGDRRSNLALLIHALVEQYRAEEDGVSIQEIDDWDFSHLDSDEPADEPGCPYQKAHSDAMFAEMTLCASLRLPWAEHESNLKRALNG